MDERKKILFLGCNFDQIGYLRELNKRDLFIVGVDKNSEAPGRSLCDEFHICGYDDIEQLIQIGIKHNFNSQDNLFTASAQFANLGASYFASEFGINFPKASSILTCLDKTKFYQSFEEHSIPIPITKKIRNHDELLNYLENSKKNINFYLKSDFSKNPNYVYKINHLSNLDNICWDHDRYFREHYVIQEEFIGQSLRLNLYGNRFNIFDFETAQKLNLNNNQRTFFVKNIINKLNNFRISHNMQNWLLKFDIILNGDNFVVLDVGMDPPSRMYALASKLKINFERHYIDQYLFGKISYPSNIDS